MTPVRQSAESSTSTTITADGAGSGDELVLEVLQIPIDKHTYCHYDVEVSSQDFKL